jgi:hypothetical protein
MAAIELLVVLLDTVASTSCETQKTVTYKQIMKDRSKHEGFDVSAGRSCSNELSIGLPEHRFNRAPDQAIGIRDAEQV